MKLAELCETLDGRSFPFATESARPTRDLVLEARGRVACAVADDDFLLDCIALEAQRLRVSRLGWGLEPFFVLPDTGIQMAFGYWAPGRRAGPHEHNDWTITAVWRNVLDVHTFDRDASYKAQRFVPKNLFQARAGSTGFIYDPCIHEPVNASTDWSLSLHISSPRNPPSGRDAGALWQEPSPVPDPDGAVSRVIENRIRAEFARQLARVASSIKLPRASLALDQSLAAASSGTRRAFKPDVREPAPCRLAKCHAELDLCVRMVTEGDEKGMVALFAHTPSGTIDGLVVSAAAHDAMVFATREREFDVHDLPGRFAPDERVQIADALEETGFFTRVS